MHLRFKSRRIIADLEYVTQYRAAFIVSLGLFAEGMHYGWSSSAIPKLLTEQYPIMQLTSDETTYIIQMFTYGSLTYTILSLADYPKLNQKSAVILSTVVMILSWVLIGTGWCASWLMVARFLAGAGRGLVYQVSVNYICEIAAPEVRGFLASLLAVMMNLGLFVIYSLGPHVHFKYVAIFGAAVSVLELVAIKYIPESPYILLLRGKVNDARRVLKSLRDLWNVEEELDSMTASVHRQDNENYNFWSIFTVASNRRAMLIIIVLNLFQLLSGVHIIIHHILKLTGGNVKSYALATVTALMCTASCMLTAYLLDIVGRKSVLMLSFLVSGVSLVTIGCYTYVRNELQIDINDYNMLPLACLVLYTIMYKLGISMVPLVMSGELFPMNVKNSASTLCTIISVLLSFATINLLSAIQTMFGIHLLYLFCGTVCFIGVVFTRYFVPETARNTLEEIQVKLKR